MLPKPIWKPCSNHLKHYSNLLKPWFWVPISGVLAFSIRCESIVHIFSIFDRVWVWQATKEVVSECCGVRLDGFLLSRLVTYLNLFCRACLIKNRSMDGLCTHLLLTYVLIMIEAGGHDGITKSTSPVSSICLNINIPMVEASSMNYNVLKK